MTHHAIGIDLGGTNLRAALYRDPLSALAADGPVQPQAILQHRELVGEARDPDSIADRLAAVVMRIAADLDGTIPVGVGFAGMLRGHEGMVAVSPHLRWRDVPLGDMLRARLGERFPVGIYNDVNAITYGEHAVGAGYGTRDVLAVFVGTGVGGGIVSGGELITGGDHCAAEIGHMKVVLGDDARPCACGRRGCVEAYTGGIFLQARIREEIAAGAESRALVLAGSIDELYISHVDQAAAEGDAYALALYEEIAPLLGVTLANAVTLLNPQRLILGGGVLSRTPILREHVIAAFEVACNPPALASVEIVEAALGDDAGIVGSALLAARG
jgi:glucokinase